ncbi:carbon monoxide dehydrogenase subunit G [Xanthobacter sp. KR7-225]|uniref:SRPBCC family protein n=1 Tax=Xanthobacter sp. KR7-225 TaxID=3156613 RepID=UPI0032B3F4C2
MDMTGEQRIPAPREAVWRALNDPEVLKACIPGCQELNKLSDTEMTATVVLKVGPVSARFQGAVTLLDLDPPKSYRISGEGQGGVAGFAKGDAKVSLEEDGAETILRYQVEAQVGGKLAQLGARLIDATAKQMSGAFFKRFGQEVLARQEAAAAPAAPPEALAPAAPAPRNGGEGAPAAPAAAPRPASAAPARAAEAAAAPAPGRWNLFGIGALLAAFAVAGFLFGGMAGTTGAGLPVSTEFVLAVLLILVAAIGYLFGRLDGRQT